MNLEKIKSKIHFNLPSLFGLIAQLILTITWFTESVDFCYGLILYPVSPKMILDAMDFSVGYYINILLLILGIVPWVHSTITTSRRGDLFISMFVSYLEIAIVTAFMFLCFPEEYRDMDIVTLNGLGVLMVVSAFASIVLCHIAYISIRKYRKSLKSNTENQQIFQQI